MAAAGEKVQVAIICGGISAEHEVSLHSARNIVAAVDRAKFNLILIGIDKKGQWFKHDPTDFLLYPDSATDIALRNDGLAVTLARRGDRTFVNSDNGAEHLDAVFPVLHGTYGEDGAVQGFFRMLQTPLVGCDLTSSAICMDKDLAKQVLYAAGIQVAPGQVMTRYQRDCFCATETARRLGWPIFVKPARLGSSVGISKAENEDALMEAIDIALQYDSKILLEAAIKGREMECAVLGNGNPQVSVPGEIVPLDDFYSYKAKYVDERGAELIAPANLTAEEKQSLQEIARHTFQVLGCRGMARVDMFLTAEGKVYVNEVNTIPGFTKISMYPKLWSVSGLPYPKLIENLIDLALKADAEDKQLQTDMKLSA